MLRRTASQPIGLDRVDRLGSIVSYTSMQNLSTSFARSSSSLVLEHDCPPVFCGQVESTQGDNEGPGWQFVERCSMVGYEGPDRDEMKASEDCDAMYAAEEEEVWNSCDLSLEEKRDIVDLLHCKNRLMKRNTDLQKVLDACEDTNIHLEMENSALKSQVKSMKQSIQDAEKLMEEMDVIRGALAESEAVSNTLKVCINKLEKENKSLTDQIETITSEMSNILPERESDRNKITALTQHIKALQLQVEKREMQLNEKTEVINSKDLFINQLQASLEEFATLDQTLKSTVRDLEDQVELSRISAGGSFLTLDGTLLTATNNHMTLAEELGLMPGLPESDEVEEIDEAIQVEEYGLKDIEEVELEVVDEDVVYDMEDVNKPVDEKDDVKHDHSETVAVEEKGLCAAEQENKPCHQSVGWLADAYRSFRRGFLAASAFSLGVVLPLSVVSAIMPRHHSGTGLDFIWSTACHILEPYYSLQFVDMPPF